MSATSQPNPQCSHVPLSQPPITTAAQVEQFMTVVEYHSAPTPVYGDDGCSTIQVNPHNTKQHWGAGAWQPLAAPGSWLA